MKELLGLEFTVISEVFRMPTVQLTDTAELKRKNLAGVLITKDTPVEFPLRLAISMLGHPDFMFTFTKDDEKGILELEDAKLKLASIEIKKDIKTHRELVDLLIPKKAKATKPKTTKPKTVKIKSSKKE